jgi:ABC-2 type transport system permease protein
MMTPYWSVLKLRLLNGMQYRSAALAGIATQFFFGFIFIMIFEAFYNQASSQVPMTLQELATYTWLRQALLLPEPYKLGLPPNLPTFLLFLAAVSIGLLLLVAISMLIYISVFWTLSPTGSMLIFGVVGEFFAGMIIPIPLMPSWMQTIAYALPFHLTLDFPFRLYSGNIPPNEALFGMCTQLGWLIILVIVGKLLLSKGLRRVVVQGG